MAIFWRINYVLPASVAQSDARPTGDQEVVFDSRRVRHHSFVKIDYEIFPTVIIFLPLIQKGQLLVSGERMCTSTGLPLRGLSLPSKSVVR